MKGKNRVSLWSRREVEEEKEVVFSEKVLCKNSSLSLSPSSTWVYLSLPVCASHEIAESNTGVVHNLRDSEKKLIIFTHSFSISSITCL